MSDDGNGAIGIGGTAAAIPGSECNTTGVAVSFLFGSGAGTDTENRHYTSRRIVALLGVANGVSLSGDLPGNPSHDCMCLYGRVCYSLALQAPCTIGGPGTLLYGSDGVCTTATSMDEGAVFLAAFGSH